MKGLELFESNGMVTRFTISHFAIHHPFDSLAGCGFLPGRGVSARATP